MSVRPPRKPVVKPIVVVVGVVGLVGVVDSAAVCAQWKEKRLDSELDCLVRLRALGSPEKQELGSR